MRFSHKLKYGKALKQGGFAMYHRLRDLREDHDLSQCKLADLLHVSQTTYSRYESGALDIPSAALVALACFYETSTDYLLDLTDDPIPYLPSASRKDLKTRPAGKSRKDALRH
jgi:transcriptional regulator with XRE-family HTH domain